MKPPKTRNNGQWSEARFQSFIKSLLRKGSQRWGPINSTKKAAWVERGKYLCAGCQQVVPLTVGGKKNVFVDHIDPVVDTKRGFQGWDEYIERLFCEEENLQLLCSDCHSRKGSEEREERKKYK